LIVDKIQTIELKNFSKKINRAIMGTEFEKEVSEMFSNKSYAELVQLEKEINQTLDCPKDFKIDIEYWENVLKKLKIKKVILSFIRD